jgi:glycosyltransferase involved in cell wall biosynthesis
MMLLKLVDMAQQRGDSLVVVSLVDGGEIATKIKAQGVLVINIRQFRQVVAVIRELRPDVFFGWMYHGNLVALFLKSFFGGAAKLHWNIRHSLDDLSNDKLLTRLTIILNRLLSPFCDSLIYNSQNSKDQHEASGFSSQGGKVIANGFDLARCESAIDKSRLTREQLGFSPDDKLVVLVARFHPIKNHELFFSTLAALNRQSIVYGLLVGAGVTIENEKIATMIPRGIEDRFRLMGERDDVLDIIAAADCLCLTSYGEAFPNVLGEAMACKVPCVSTDVGDARQILGDSGVVVGGFSAELMAEAITSILQMSVERKSDLAERGKERVARRYSIQEIAGQFFS